MRSAGFAAIAASLFSLMAHAAPPIVFDGERYEQRFENRKGAVPVVEYVRAGETLKDWSRLTAIRHFPRESDPKAAAANLANVVRQHNPQARSQVIVKDDGSEAVVDFVTWASGDDRMEFNVHRYRRVPGTQGLVAYQFAWRFRTTELPDSAATVRTNRQRFLDAMLKAEWPNPFR